MYILYADSPFLHSLLNGRDTTHTPQDCFLGTEYNDFARLIQERRNWSHAFFALTHEFDFYIVQLITYLCFLFLFNDMITQIVDFVQFVLDHMWNAPNLNSKVTINSMVPERWDSCVIDVFGNIV